MPFSPHQSRLELQHHLHHINRQNLFAVVLPSGNLDLGISYRTTSTIEMEAYHLRLRYPIRELPGRESLWERLMEIDMGYVLNYNLIRSCLSCLPKVRLLHESCVQVYVIEQWHAEAGVDMRLDRGKAKGKPDRLGYMRIIPSSRARLGECFPLHNWRKSFVWK